jgi:hypothetical protein
MWSSADRRPLVMLLVAASFEGAAAFAGAFAPPIHMEAIRMGKCANVKQSAIGSRTALRPLGRVSMTAAAAATESVSEQAVSPTTKQVNLGPHIKVGKKGAILNLWGLWVMTYSVALGLIGYLYLKIRVILGILSMGLLKPTAEHCCWIMHMWCKVVLWIGLSSPKVFPMCLQF